MASDEIPTIAADKAQGDQKRSSSGSSGPSSTGVERVDEGVVNWLFAAMSQHGEDIDIPVHEEDAERELTEAEIEAFDLPEGVNFSVESLFGLDVDRPYVGDPKVEDDEKLSEVEGTSSIDRHVTVSLGHSINGYYASKIEEQFGEGVHIRVGMGAKGVHDDPYERAQYVRFKTTESGAKSERRKRRSMWMASDIDFGKSEYEEWCSEADVEAYPRSNNGED